MTRPRVPVLLLPCALLLRACLPAPAQEPARVIRGPYLEAVAGDSAVVCWRTDRPAAARLEYGPAGRPAVQVSGREPSSDHCERLTGLDPSTEYAYRLIPSSAAAHAFHSAEGPGEPRLRFAVLGDSGYGDGGALWRVAKRLEAEAPQFVLHLGDVVYPDGADEDYDEKYFRPYAGLLDRVPVYPVPGNHDYANYHLSARKGRGWLRKNFLSIHRLPEPRVPRPDREDAAAYYSFDRGPAHFAALDANRTFYIPAAPSILKDSPQLRWLEADLAASAAAWKFVFIHEPVYSTGHHGPTETLVESLAPILERRGVDVVFQGHDHHYERTHPIRAGRRSPDGVVYVVAGTGGVKLTGQRRREVWSAFFARRHGFVRAAIDGRRLVLEAVGEGGEVFDRWEKAK